MSSASMLVRQNQRRISLNLQNAIDSAATKRNDEYDTKPYQEVRASAKKKKKKKNRSFLTPAILFRLLQEIDYIPCQLFL